MNEIEMLVIADQSIPYLKGILEPYTEVHYLASSEFTPENIRGAEVLIVRSIDKCSANLLRGSQVKLITTATIGYDHIDTKYCDENGIIWKNAPGCNAASVGQYVFSSLLSLSLRKVETLKGKTIGIVGVGHVGKEVERLCKGYGMSVLRNDPPRAIQEGTSDFVSLEEIAEEADIITFHTPLTKEGEYPTYHLANQAFFEKCRKAPWFINASRGSVHKTKDVLNAHQKGLISEMILDCWENEPFIDKSLLAISSIATPHIAGFSADGKANATRMCIEYINEIYNLQIPTIHKIAPVPLQNRFIDMNQYKENRVENAFLATFTPVTVDKELRKRPEQFEWLRSHYKHPREPKAYTILNATNPEKEIVSNLGFNLL